MKNIFLIILFLNTILCSCKQNLNNEEEVRHWLSGKEFTSISKGSDIFYRDGSVGFAVGETKISFYQNKMK